MALSGLRARVSTALCGLPARARGRAKSHDARTINLARARTCERPQQVQKLVSAHVQSCPHVDAIQMGYQTPRVVPVRICRRCDLERACQPKLCDCPPRLPPRTSKEILCSWTVLGLKGAFAGGLVYWTMSEGLWGDGADIEDLYRRIRKTISSDVSDGDEQLPRIAKYKYQLLNGYNKCILKIMDILVAEPLRIKKKIKDKFYPCEPIEEDPKKKRNNL